MIPYPSSSVWYIRVSSKGETGQGSGVGVRLRKKGYPGTEETYILTCAHVVRRAGKDDDRLGARHDSIRVFPAGYGYDETNGIKVEPVTSITPLETLAGGEFYNQPVKDIENADWVLLAFTEPKWANLRAVPSIVWRWHLSSLKQGDQCVISGYPDGEIGFAGHDNGNDNIVRPKPGYAIQTIENVVDNVITFDGTHSRPGMSGGGVFRKDGVNYFLCGLHRARYDDSLQLKAVAIQSILLRLDDIGYEPVNVKETVIRKNVWPIGVATVAILLLSIGLWVLTPRIPLASGIAATPTPGLQIVDTASPLYPDPNGKAVVIEGEFRFDNNHKYHIAYTVPDSGKLVVHNYYLDKESVNIDVLAVAEGRSARLATLEAGSGGNLNDPWVFPKGSEVVLFGVNETGQFKYRFTGEIQPITAPELSGQSSQENCAGPANGKQMDTPVQAVDPEMSRSRTVGINSIGDWRCGGGKGDTVSIEQPTQVISEANLAFAKGDVEAKLGKGGPTGVFLWAHLHAIHPDRLGASTYRVVVLVRDEGGFYYLATPLLFETVEGVPLLPDSHRHCFGQFHLPSGPSATALKACVDANEKLIVEIHGERNNEGFFGDLKGGSDEAIRQFFSSKVSASELLDKLNGNK